MPLEHDINIAINGPFWVEVANPEHAFTALIWRSIGTCFVAINSKNFWPILATVANFDKWQLWQVLHFALWTNCDNYQQLWMFGRIINNSEELWQYWPCCLSRIESDIMSVMFLFRIKFYTYFTTIFLRVVILKFTISPTGLPTTCLGYLSWPPTPKNITEAVRCRR